jgi:hypothetical protein
MIRCREVMHKIASDELESSSLWTRFEVKVHLWMCRHCRTYSRQMQAIGESARRLLREAPSNEGGVGTGGSSGSAADSDAHGVGCTKPERVADTQAVRRLEREILERIDREAGRSAPHEEGR